MNRRILIARKGNEEIVVCSDFNGDTIDITDEQFRYCQEIFGSGFSIEVVDDMSKQQILALKPILDRFLVEVGDKYYHYHDGRYWTIKLTKRGLIAE